MDEYRKTASRPSFLIFACGILITILTSLLSSSLPSFGAASAKRIISPPVNKPFDYQLGGSYAPPKGTAIVVRDRKENVAKGLYNICYVNAYQTQPDETVWWKKHHTSLLLKKGPKFVYDTTWNEILLDTSTVSKRYALARIVNSWVDDCARKGFNAVEFDNLDSYSRSQHKLTLGNNSVFAKTITAHAHSLGLAVGQKNTPELKTLGRNYIRFDFVIAEECQRYNECAVYQKVYGLHMLEIEYTDYPTAVYKTACRLNGNKLSIILRDRNLLPKGMPNYIYSTC